MNDSKVVNTIVSTLLHSDDVDARRQGAVIALFALEGAPNVLSRSIEAVDRDDVEAVLGSAARLYGLMRMNDPDGKLEGIPVVRLLIYNHELIDMAWSMYHLDPEVWDRATGEFDVRPVEVSQTSCDESKPDAESGANG